MDEYKRNSLKQRSNPQFKRKGSTKNAKWNFSSHERSSEDSQSSDTSYCILCQSKKIGSVIGKGGSIIKALREETQAKITVADSVPGSDDRIVIISSPSTKLARRHNENPETREENGSMEPHCAAQDALLKVHNRILEEDLKGVQDKDKHEIGIITRLLVPNNLVGCLLGRKGDVIQKLRSETGASIRVLSAEHLPACAMTTDELVQISGKPALVRKAVYEVSTLLHQNPRKDKPTLSFPMVHGAQGFHPPGPPVDNMIPPGKSMWSQSKTNLNGMPPALGMGGYRNQLSGFGRADFDYVPPSSAGEAPSDFTMKILCSAAKIGGVIGKGGVNVKQLEHETGASIRVEDVAPESDERVIRVSSLESLWDPRSQTIDAILQLQSKTSEFSDKGMITTRLLVPSNKVGCILGQGGQVINEMRRRTQADIRVLSKDDKPRCASADEELVQISGSIGVAKDALVEISSRLRERCLRDANSKVESTPVRPLPGFVPSEDFRSGDPQRSGVMGAGSSRRYEHSKGTVREYDQPSYPDLPIATRYSGISSPPEMKFPDHSFGSAKGTGGYNINEFAGSSARFRDPRSMGPGFIDDIRGTSDHMNAAHNVFPGSSENLNAGRPTFQGYRSPAGQSSSVQQGAYHQSYAAQQSAYQSYPAKGGYPSGSPSQLPYQNTNSHQAPYQSINPQQQQQPPPYKNMAAQGSYHY
ncbi:putative ribulose bisphosphate carboxylase small chain 2A, chloroplastic [Capsicum annuum]|uniref:RNA-binding KH domain-containing protein RCF3 n=1 Tax=Capsicum annuum TaxID=4072 RepID=UPI001FB19287|nr:RNA-binding KH domain-containing protein RCF3 [Capsicum annuum]XP_016554413.2 RNA-binding KH domain-containing protein RCF3 [Capsicum annuum]XP_016554414.2 RNA-binding KH domain-containing protein RCF3 [Capsicum annuum]XP_047267708.1 RNA-binding KH domain-containing protein RCF3 [Capsicum annuum]KAF3663399.1 putative ribulose bisphosphate carboxylase small chain 2A, chloroplastic [Capsicum annuum]KAF3674677.1 putative ribulose bisphosphate carboxylase small chain 2A, chloroplastic [Capsicum